LLNKLYGVFVCARAAGSCSRTWKSVKQNAFTNCAALATVLFTTLIENLKLCSSAEAVYIVLNLLLNFEQKMKFVFL